VEKTTTPDLSAKGSRFDKGKTGVNGAGRVQEGERFINVATGWRPTCDCPEHEPVPCIVLDPFGGSGTTLEVATKLGRQGVITELKPQYVELAHERNPELPLFEVAL